MWCSDASNGSTIGHAGHEVSEHTVEQLPEKIRNSLSRLFPSSPASQHEKQIPSILHDELIKLDEELLQNFSSIFLNARQSQPPTIDQIVEIVDSMSNEGIRQLINDQDGPTRGRNAAIMRRVMCGSTALIALMDPAKENLWIVNLGDCQASTCSRCI